MGPTAIKIFVAGYVKVVTPSTLVLTLKVSLWTKSYLTSTILLFLFPHMQTTVDITILILIGWYNSWLQS